MLRAVFALVNAHQHFKHLYCITVIATFYSLNAELYLLMYYGKHPEMKRRSFKFWCFGVKVLFTEQWVHRARHTAVGKKQITCYPTSKKIADVFARRCCEKIVIQGKRKCYIS